MPKYDLFSGAPAGPKHSERSRFMLILLGAALILAGVIYAIQFLPAATPYDKAVELLKPGMNQLDVEKALGQDNFVSSGFMIDPNTRADRIFERYKVEGADLPLTVEFTGNSSDRFDTSHKIDKWCMFLGPKQGPPETAAKDALLHLACRPVR